MMRPVVGAQLFTVRESMRTMPDILTSLKKIADIGYTEVQMSGQGPVDPGELARAARDVGLKIVATHMAWSRFLEDLDGVIGDHKTFECVHTAIGSLPGEYRSEDGLKRFVDELEPIAGRLAAEGMDFSYHNHSHELMRCGDTTWLGRLYDTADAGMLKAELDTYWIQAGGGDPAAWIRRCSGREPLLHLKDMCMVDGKGQCFAPVGEGNMNWAVICEAAAECGVEHMLVEQDNCYGADPFEALALSYRNLKEMGYE